MRGGNINSANSIQTVSLYSNNFHGHLTQSGVYNENKKHHERHAIFAWVL